MLSDDLKHPIILPTKMRLAKLIAAELHLITLHGGTQIIFLHFNEALRCLVFVNSAMELELLLATTHVWLNSKSPYKPTVSCAVKKGCPAYYSVRAIQNFLYNNILHCSQARQNTCFGIFKLKYPTFNTIKNYYRLVI